jgi:hypothetical protein
MNELTAIETKETGNMVDDSFIDEAIEFINETAKKTLYVGYEEIGNYILKNFFNDDIELASSKNPRKQVSFNQLCKRKELAVHPSRLALMVRVAVQEKFLLAHNIDTKSLTYTQKSSLVKLQNNEQKIEFINKHLEQEKLVTTRGLDKDIKQIIAENSPNEDNNPTSIVRATSTFIKKFETVINLDDKILKIKENGLSKMPDSRRKNLETKVQKLKKTIEANAKKAEKMSSNCDELLQKLSSIAKERKLNPPKRGRKPSKSSKK